jgi:hypothetical protein
VALAGLFMPVTVARPWRIFTAFRLSSQYPDSLIYNERSHVNTFPPPNPESAVNNLPEIL